MVIKAGTNLAGIKGYINPTTGEHCTFGEYTKACADAGIAPTSTPTATPTTTPEFTEGGTPWMTLTPGPTGSGTLTSTAINPETGKPYTAAELAQFIPEGQTLPEYLTAQYGTEGGPYRLGYPPTGGAGGAVTPTTPTTPTFGAGAEIPLPEVTPAPPYEKTPEQIAFEEMYSGQLTDWVEAGGYGIPEETQAQMIQQQTDSLKAREQESLRVMRNTMERRGLTNSGLIFANEQAIRSGTSVAIAGAIADVQIKSALLKLASFETAMGQAGQFLDYLSLQTQLKYAPEFATWKAQQQAILYQWQGEMDVLKLDINQAYQQQNIALTAQLQGQLNAQQNAFTMQLEQMKIDAANEAAESEGFWSTIGTVLGFGLSFLL
jgi:hypothetical protein